MKKIIIVISALFICGCSLLKDEYAKYEHYDLKNYSHKVFTFVRDNNEPPYDI